MIRRDDKSLTYIFMPLPMLLLKLSVFVAAAWAGVGAAVLLCQAANWIMS